MSQGEADFLDAWRSYGLADPQREHRFDESRGWRFDFAWPDFKVAVEIEGGTWGRSRHTSGKGFANDLDKYNRAVELGWSILRFTPSHLKDDPDGCVELVVGVMNRKLAATGIEQRAAS